MHQFVAYGTAIMTIGLVLASPRTSIGASLGPPAAAVLGVLVLLIVGVVSPGDLAGSAAVLWRPFVTVLSLMLATSVAQRLGVIDYFTALVRPRAGEAPLRVFRHVFVLAVATSAVLTNDAAVLLLTPLIVDLVRRSYPDRPDLVVPFAFAVFAAAGVAPLVISNPMNLIVADYAGIGFNAYAARMIPIAIAGWVAAMSCSAWYSAARCGMRGAEAHGASRSRPCRDLANSFSY
jgi:arsenical pump membrane protein